MARLNATAPNFADYLSIGKAAEFLGVSTATLRNWDRSGKLKSRRHPQNGYRIYLHEDLEAVLRSADLSTLTDESFAPQVDWTQMHDAEHFVQFYENDEFLIESASGFVGAALRAGDASAVIVTPEHGRALQARLIACGVDVIEAAAAGRYVVLDAAETLSRFMVGRSPDPQRFDESVGGVMAQLSEGGRRIHAFGEMVALLWSEGNRDGAIDLEQLWNNLAQSHRFALFLRLSDHRLRRREPVGGVPRSLLLSFAGDSGRKLRRCRYGRQAAASDQPVAAKGPVAGSRN